MLSVVVVKLSIALNLNDDMLVKFTAKLKDWKILNNFLDTGGQKWKISNKKTGKAGFWGYLIPIFTRFFTILKFIIYW
jgi:hypothetical protein